jgi:hypothetical protein
MNWTQLDRDATLTAIQDRSLHDLLTYDLREHLWTLRGDEVE